jgi:biofilm PGA synthesis N-glycosyltransferase PgaC
MTLTYAVITPARDEAENVERVARCLVAQTVLPAAWVIVDNGSCDGTLAVAERLACEHPWIRAIEAPPSAKPQPGAPIVRAFHAGLAALTSEADVVVKLDADVSFCATYFEQTLAAFGADARLGIAGGVCMELREGEWAPVQVTLDHVRGASRAYRRECLQQLLPLPERTGWDTVDEVQATVRGWTTRTLPHLAFEHHRAVGARDGDAGARWREKGRAAHYLGYRPIYLLLRSLYNLRRDFAAAEMMVGYVGALAARSPRHPDLAARRHLRQEQRVRSLRRRAVELRAD